MGDKQVRLIDGDALILHLKNSVTINTRNFKDAKHNEQYLLAGKLKNAIANESNLIGIIEDGFFDLNENQVNEIINR